MSQPDKNESLHPEHVALREFFNAAVMWDFDGHEPFYRTALDIGQRMPPKVARAAKRVLKTGEHR